MNNKTSNFGYLVKFTKAEYIKDVVKNKLKASFPHEFNDPFDSLFNLTDQEITEIAKNNKVSIEYVKFHLSLFQSIQITSFINVDPISHNANLMWAHYANSGKGIAILYDFNEVKNLQTVSFQKVHYIEEKICERELLETFYKSKNDNYSKFIEIFYSHKLNIWSYENESRVLSFGLISTIVQHFHQFIKPDYELQADLFNVRHLSINTIKELSSVFKEKKFNHRVYHCGILSLESRLNKVVLPIHSIESLFVKTPKPKKIIMGWNINAKERNEIITYCNECDIELTQIELVNNKMNCYNEIMVS